MGTNSSMFVRTWPHHWGSCMNMVVFLWFICHSFWNQLLWMQTIRDRYNIVVKTMKTRQLLWKLLLCHLKETSNVAIFLIHQYCIYNVYFSHIWTKFLKVKSQFYHLSIVPYYFSLETTAIIYINIRNIASKIVRITTTLILLLHS